LPTLLFVPSAARPCPPAAVHHRRVARPARHPRCGAQPAHVPAGVRGHLPAARADAHLRAVGACGGAVDFVGRELSAGAACWSVVALRRLCSTVFYVLWPLRGCRDCSA